MAPAWNYVCVPTDTYARLAAAHEQFEAEFCSWVEGRGYVVQPSTTYHAHGDNVLLGRNTSATALVERTRPDRLVTRGDDWACFVDLKTNPGRHENASVELVPLAHHLHNADGPVPVSMAYVYHDVVRADVGRRAWMVEDTPDPVKVFMPEHDPRLVLWIRAHWPNTPIIHARCGGSGDACAIIARADLLALPRPSAVFPAT